MGLYGQSLGGYLAPRSAAHDPRVMACVASGGSYDRTFMLKNLEDPSQRARHCSTNMGYRWRPRAGDFMARHLGVW